MLHNTKAWWLRCCCGSLLCDGRLAFEILVEQISTWCHTRTHYSARILLYQDVTMLYFQNFFAIWGACKSSWIAFRHFSVPSWLRLYRRWESLLWMWCWHFYYSMAHKKTDKIGFWKQVRKSKESIPLISFIFGLCTPPEGSVLDIYGGTAPTTTVAPLKREFVFVLIKAVPVFT